MIRRLLGLPIRHRRALLFVAWGTALILLVKTQRAGTFLRPDYVILLEGAYVLLLFLFTAEVFRGREPGPRAPALLAPAILLLPLAFLVNAQGVQLDGYTLQKRMVGVPRLGPPDRTAAANTPRTASQTTPEPPLPDGSSSQLVEVELVDFYARPDELEGRTVSVIGMVSKHAKAMEDLGPEARLLFRFQVACCAADAQPVSVVAIRRAGQPELENDTWVKVLGRYVTRSVRGERVPVIEDAILFKTPAPRRPYLY